MRDDCATVQVVRVGPQALVLKPGLLQAGEQGL